MILKYNYDTPEKLRQFNFRWVRSSEFTTDDLFWSSFWFVSTENYL